MSKIRFVLLFITICLLVIQFRAHADNDKTYSSTGLFPNEVTTHVDVSGNYQYTNLNGEINLKTKSSAGWVNQTITFPNSKNHDFSVIGSSANQTDLYLLEAFNGRNGKAAKVHKTSFVDNNWTEPAPLTIDGDRKLDPVYSAHVAANGQVMILSLKDLRVKGSQHLYISQLKEDDTWSWPVLLDESINSLATESAPYLSPDGKDLYFSSDRTGGFGASDIYVAHRLDNTYQAWTAATNLGPAINTVAAETFYATVDNNKSWIVQDSGDALVASTNYEAIEHAEENIVIAEHVVKVKATIIEAPKAEINIPENAFKIEDETIFFDLNSPLLSDFSQENLANLVVALKANPEATLKVLGHTCDLGDTAYNFELSKKRAMSTIQYLVTNGISLERLSYQALGESTLVSKENKALNRRVELKVDANELVMKQ